MTDTIDRCTFSRPGHPSVNHPGGWVVKPWRCVHKAGHDSPHAPVAGCPRTVSVTGPGGVRPWPCVRAHGHDGDCKPGEGAGYVNRPLRDMTRDELIGVAALAFTHAELTDRNARDLNRRLRRWEDDVTAVAAHVLDGVKSPHGNNHTADCWTRHPHCFAFAIIGCGGLDRAVEHFRGEATTP